MKWYDKGGKWEIGLRLDIPCLVGVGIVVRILSIWFKVELPGKSGFPVNKKVLY